MVVVLGVLCSLRGVNLLEAVTCKWMRVKSAIGEFPWRDLGGEKKIEHGVGLPVSKRETRARLQYEAHRRE